MTTDPKVLERIGKLLRLAAPSSGTTEAERASAALEAARLIEEFDVDVSSKPEAKPHPTRVSRGVWVPSVALQHCSCSWCSQLIAPGDVVWIRVRADNFIDYRHNYEPCKVE